MYTHSAGVECIGTFVGKKKAIIASKQDGGACRNGPLFTEKKKLRKLH